MSHSFDKSFIPYIRTGLMGKDYVSYYRLISLTICLKNYQLALTNLSHGGFEMPNFFTSADGVQAKYAIFDSFVHNHVLPESKRLNILQLLYLNHLTEVILDEELYAAFMRLYVEFTIITANQREANTYQGIELLGDIINIEDTVNIKDTVNIEDTVNIGEPLAMPQRTPQRTPFGAYANICQRTTSLPFVTRLSDEMLEKADSFFNVHAKQNSTMISERVSSERVISSKPKRNILRILNEVKNNMADELAIQVIDKILKRYKPLEQGPVDAEKVCAGEFSQIKVDVSLLDFDDDFYHPYAEYVADIIIHGDAITKPKNSKMLWYWYRLREAIRAYPYVHAKLEELNFDMSFRQWYTLVFRNIDLSFLAYDYADLCSVYNSVSSYSELYEVLADMVPPEEPPQYDNDGKLIESEHKRDKLVILNRMNYRYYFDYKIPVRYQEKRIMTEDWNKIPVYSPVYAISKEEAEMMEKTAYISSFLKANLFYIPYLTLCIKPTTDTFKTFFNILSMCDNLTSITTRYSSCRSLGLALNHGASV